MNYFFPDVFNKDHKYYSILLTSVISWIYFVLYFNDLPKETMAITCHTGNIYLTSAYLYEYYNDKGPNSKLIIREKIILNISILYFLFLH